MRGVGNIYNCAPPLVRVTRSIAPSHTFASLHVTLSAMTDLLSFLELPTCESLNAETEHPLRHVLAEECRDDKQLCLKSDVDPGALPLCVAWRQAAPELTASCLRAAELLIVLRFRTLVKVSAIAVQAPADKGPSSVRVRCCAAPAFCSRLVGLAASP